MKISELHPNIGSRKRKKLVGRGPGSGHGKTSCKGSKGQLSRSGAKHRPGFEGGQNPLIKRLPKRGFVSQFKKSYSLVNISSLNLFEDNAIVTPELLREKNLIKNINSGVKILGDGELKKPLTVQAHRFSESAQEKIEKAGGKSVLIGGKSETPEKIEKPVKSEKSEKLEKTEKPEKPAVSEKPKKSEK